MGFSDFLNRHGVKYKILRNDTLISEEIGLPNHEQNTNRPYIGWSPGTDISVGDYVENPVGEFFFITDVQTAFANGKPLQIKAYYITQSEKERQLNKSINTVFNIGQVSGSIIGNNNIATLNYQTSIQEIKDKAQSEAPDDEDLKKVISLLEMIVDEQVPVKQGLFSKLSSVFEKHSWLTGAVASAILNWLTTQPLP